MKPKLLVFSHFDRIFICALVLLSGLFIGVPFFNYNNRAVLYMVQKKYDKAEQKWLQVLNKQSLIPFYRMNLALNYLLDHQADKAIQEYTVTGNLVKEIKKPGRFQESPVPRLRGEGGIVRGDNRPSRESGNLKKPQKSARPGLDEYKKKVLFYSFFNSALAATVKGEVKNALGFYQKALRVQPESLEVKTNIELLMNTNPSAKDKKSSSQDSDNQDNKEGEEKGKSGKEEGERKKSGESQGQGKEENKDENSKKDKKDDNDGAKKERGKGGDSENQEGSGKESSIDKKQREAILKAILEGEKKIRERRNKSGRDSSAIEKDW